MTHRSEAGLALAAIDFLICLVCVIATLVNPNRTPPSILTQGAYAVTIQWAGKSANDVDLYVQDPAGNVAYYLNPSAGLMYLEHDDRGRITDAYSGIPQLSTNHERVILRGVLPGEYVVNVHMYYRLDPGSTPVHVELWRIAGNDRKLLAQDLVLAGTGDEQTAFRFVLDRQGNMVSHNRLPKQLVSSVPQ